MYRRREYRGVRVRVDSHGRIAVLRERRRHLLDHEQLRTKNSISFVFEFEITTKNSRSAVSVLVVMSNAIYSMLLWRIFHFYMLSLRWTSQWSYTHVKAPRSGALGAAESARTRAGAVRCGALRCGFAVRCGRVALRQRAARVHSALTHTLLQQWHACSEACK